MNYSKLNDNYLRNETDDADIFAACEMVYVQTIF